MKPHTESEHRKRKYYRKDEIEILLHIIAVVGAALLFPWTFAIFERVDFHDLTFEGIHRSRAFWLIPLFYLFGGIGTILHFPAHLELFWAFHVLFLAQVSEFILYEVSYLTAISLPLTEQFTVLRTSGFLVLLGITVYAGRWLQSWDIEHECHRYISDGSYVLPFRETSDMSDTMPLTRFLPLRKDRSVLVLGETGVGKTETIKFFLNQMQAADEAPFIVFDYKASIGKSSNPTTSQRI